jgi:hypothetical protein
MSQAKWDDLYDRLSSRKLWLAILSIAFALWGYYEGRLDAVQFQTAIFGAVTAYTVAEGITDAAGAYRPKPAAGDAQTVNVGTEAPPTVAAVTTPPAKRIRPSRAKPKPTPGRVP